MKIEEETLVIGFDAYNQAVTGNVSMPIRNKSADADHIPVVIIVLNKKKE